MPPAPPLRRCRNRAWRPHHSQWLAERSIDDPFDLAHDNLRARTARPLLRTPIVEGRAAWFIGEDDGLGSGRLFLHDLWAPLGAELQLAGLRTGEPLRAEVERQRRSTCQPDLKSTAARAGEAQRRDSGGCSQDPAGRPARNRRREAQQAASEWANSSGQQAASEWANSSSEGQQAASE